MQQRKKIQTLNRLRYNSHYGYMYGDSWPSEADRMHLVRDLVERFHNMGLGDMVPVALIPEDGAGRICGQPGCVSLYRNRREEPQGDRPLAPVIPLFREKK